MISLFLALKRDEICQSEVMGLARRVIVPLLIGAAREYLKTQCVNPDLFYLILQTQHFILSSHPKRQQETEDPNLAPDAKRPRHSASENPSAPLEYLRLAPPTESFPTMRPPIAPSFSEPLALTRTAHAMAKVGPISGPSMMRPVTPTVSLPLASYDVSYKNLPPNTSPSTAHLDPPLALEALLTSSPSTSGPLLSPASFGCSRSPNVPALRPPSASSSKSPKPQEKHHPGSSMANKENVPPRYRR
ncbi:hypothetical protein DXG01_002823 [Tephrocybe rancida]|nr:hypothetical protein DXG01_002823 [Tephrocybe rancida]